MANALYNLWKQEVQQGSANSSLSGTVRACFLDTAVYTFSQTHQFFSTLTGDYPSTRAACPALGTKTFTAGTFDAADTTFSAFSNGSVSVEAMALYIDDGVADASSRLVLFLDTSITGIPFTPSGADVIVQWNAGGIFTL